MTERSLACVGLVGLLALAALMSAHAGVAYGQTTLADPDYWKQTTERRDTVYGFVYGQSPQSIPASYDPVREANDILAQEQRALPPSNPTSRSIWQRIRAITEKTELSPALRTLGTITLAAETFQLGWKIGTGLNAKFLKIGIPERATSGVSYSEATWASLRWRTAGSLTYAGASYPESDGWVGYFNNYNGSLDSRWFDEPCTYSGITPPAPLVIAGPVASTATCAIAGQPSAPINVRYAYLPENGLEAPGPIEAYTGQPATKVTSAPTPPAQSSVEQAIDTELGKVENGVLRTWLNYQLGSPGERDPISGAVNMPDCEGETIDACTAALESLGITDYQVQTLPESNLSFANGEVVTTSPAPGTSVDPASVITTIAANPATRVKSEKDSRCERDTYSAPGDPGPAPADGTPYPQIQAAPTPWNGPYSAFDPASTPWQPINALMRYGLQPTNPDKGWGWRHIKTKHGYGATEMSETEQAFATDPAPTLMYESTRQYAFHLYYEMADGPGTVWCVRTVLLELKPDKLQLEMGDESPRGVTDSYTGLLLGTETP